MLNMKEVSWVDIRMKVDLLVLTAHGAAYRLRAHGKPSGLCTISGGSYHVDQLDIFLQSPLRSGLQMCANRVIEPAHPRFRSARIVRMLIIEPGTPDHEILAIIQSHATGILAPADESRRMIHRNHD